MKDKESNLINRIRKSDILPNQKRDTHKLPLHLECNLLWVSAVSRTVSNMDIIFGWNNMSALKPADFIKL